MPINKYHEIDRNRMRGMIGVESAMVIPKVYGEVFNHAKLNTIVHIPYEPGMYEHINRFKNFNAPICEIINDSINDIKRSADDLYLDSVLDNFDNSLIVRSGLFPDSDHWGASVCRYDEEKVKAYKIPSNDRLDVLSRIYKLIKGNKK